MVVSGTAPEVCRLTGALRPAKQPRCKFCVKASALRHRLLSNQRMLKKSTAARPMNRVELKVADVVTTIGITNKLTVFS